MNVVMPMMLLQNVEDKMPSRTFIFIITALFLLISTPLYAWSGKVVGISDGDTIKVLRDGKQIKIRLHGIDTPEKGQAFGKKAKKFTANMVAGKIVDVKKTDRDKYGRTVAIITVNGKNLNESLAASGFAWVYQKYCKQSYCNDWLKLEANAREKNLVYGVILMRWNHGIGDIKIGYWPNRISWKYQ